MVPRTSLFLSLAVSFSLLAGCGGGGENYRIPADHPIKPFEKPEREELVQTEEDAWDIDYDEVEEEGEGEVEEAGEDETKEGGAGASSKAPASVEAGAPSAKGELAKKVIRRHIRKKLMRIRHCYEKQLMADPKLAGTVRAEFTIGADGKVRAAKASGIGNKKVEECVAAAIRSIVFPKPKGGGEVTVKYPFKFTSES